ncbi:hypothetical protein B7P43_G06384 [Cryptotermes secundus]|nr:hypothetical protein B7P43_G06384 [Cryptotermes secundus]
MQEATELMHQCLLQKLPQSETAIQSATEQFLKESTNAAVQQLKHVSLAVDEFLSIPSYVLLPEDVPQSTQYTKEDEQLLDEEMEQLIARAKRACFMEACLRKEIEVQQKVKTVESEFKELEQLYLEDEIRKLSAHSLHSKISKTVEVTKTMKSYEKTCFEFPQQISDEDNDIADIFKKL